MILLHSILILEYAPPVGTFPTLSNAVEDVGSTLCPGVRDRHEAECQRSDADSDESFHDWGGVKE